MIVVTWAALHRGMNGAFVMQRLRSPRPSTHHTALLLCIGWYRTRFPVESFPDNPPRHREGSPGPRKCECFNVGSYVIRTGAPQRPAPADGRPDHGEFGVGENIFVAPTLLPPVSALEGALVGALVGLQRRHEEALVLSGAGPPPPAPARAGHLRGHGAAPLLREVRGRVTAEEVSWLHWVCWPGRDWEWGHETPTQRREM